MSGIFPRCLLCRASSPAMASGRRRPLLARRMGGNAAFSESLSKGILHPAAPVASGLPLFPLFRRRRHWSSNHKIIVKLMSMNTLKQSNRLFSKLKLTNTGFWMLWGSSQFWNLVNLNCVSSVNLPYNRISTGIFSRSRGDPFESYSTLFLSDSYSNDIPHTSTSEPTSTFLVLKERTTLLLCLPITPTKFWAIFGSQWGDGCLKKEISY